LHPSWQAALKESDEPVVLFDEHFIDVDPDQ